MPADSSTPAGTPSADDLLTAINELCEAYARGRIARVLAEHSSDTAEHERHTTHADYWERDSRTRYDALVPVIETAAPRPVEVEEFLPVRTRPSGHVEVHARDQHGRPVVVTLTGAKAVAVAVHLAAHAAIGLDRTGAKVDPLLPEIPTAASPVAASGTPAPATGRAPAPPLA